MNIRHQVISAALLLSALHVVAISDLPQDTTELKVMLDTTSSGALKTACLNEIAWITMFSSQKTSVSYAQQALVLARELNLATEATNALNVLGNQHMFKAEYEQAASKFEEALTLRLELGDSLLIGRSYINLANLFRLQGIGYKAEEHYQRALNVLTSESAKPEIAKALTGLGYVYQLEGRHSKAFQAFNQSLALRLQLGVPTDIAEAYMAVGSFHEALLQYDDALESYRNAQKWFSQNDFEIAITWRNVGNVHHSLGNYDSAMVYYAKALSDYQRHGQLAEAAGAMNNIAQVYSSLGNLQLAEFNQRKALAIWEKLDHAQGMAESYLNLGIILVEDRARLDSARSFMQAGLLLSQRTGLRNLKAQALKALANLEEKRGNPSASLAWLKQYTSLSDSLTANLQQSANLQYQLEKERSARIEQEALATELAAKNSEQRTLLRSAIIIFLLLGVIATAVVVILRQRKLRAELERDKRAQELDSVRNILEMQDEERKRIARDLHDRLGSTLSWVKLTFQNAEEKIDKLKAETRTSYREAVTKLDDAVELIREIAQNLDSGVLKKFGLVPAVRELVNSIQHSVDIVIEFETSSFDERQRLPLELEETLYRIVQELLNNMLKHARATEASLQLTRSASNLNLMLEDNGKGFEPDKLAEETGMGLKNIRSRLHPLNGTLEFDSRPGRGTIAIINIPINLPPNQTGSTGKNPPNA